jgi:hypothetical protein
MRGMFHKCAKGLPYRTILVTLTILASISIALTFIVTGVRYHGAYWAYVSLVTISLGLQDYNDTNGHLPLAAAKDAETGELTSWRVEVYRCQEHEGYIPRSRQNLNGSQWLRDYNSHKAWNNPDNLRLQDRGKWLFNYTRITMSPPGRSVGKAGVYTTYYKAITGSGTAFDAASPQNLRQLPRSLILVVRVEQSDTHWMEPEDLNIEQLAPSEETKRLLLGKAGYVVLFADGEGWVLSSKTPISDLCKFFTLAGAKEFDRDQILRPYRVLP